MKIQAITLDEDENPDTITVVMSRDEAAIIARLCGAIRPVDMADATGEEFRWYGPVSETYSALVGLVFNRFWDDGVNEVAPRLKVSVSKYSV